MPGIWYRVCSDNPTNALVHLCHHVTQDRHLVELLKEATTNSGISFFFKFSSKKGNIALKYISEKKWEWKQLMIHEHPNNQQE